MASKVISTPLNLSDLDVQQRVAPAHISIGPPDPAWPAWIDRLGNLAESSACPSSATRGALLGITLGAATYAAALILLGVIGL